MTHNTSKVRQPDAELRALDRLVGAWRLSGDATGTVTYRWMAGGHFLVQEGELELFGHRNTFIEILSGAWTWPGGGYRATSTRQRPLPVPPGGEEPWRP